MIVTRVLQHRAGREVLRNSNTCLGQVEHAATLSAMSKLLEGLVPGSDNGLVNGFPALIKFI